jgi:hypothetical protein
MLIVLLAMQAAPLTGERTAGSDSDFNRFDLAKARPKPSIMRAAWIIPAGTSSSAHTAR